MLILSKAKKYLLLAGWIWYWVYVPGFMLYVFSMMASIEQANQSGEPPTAIFAGFAIVFVLHLLTILIMIAQLVFYIWHIITKNPALTQNSKVMWALLVFMFNVFIMPVYWWLYIRTAPEDQAELEARQASVAQTMS